jgi:flagella basal body P-ring formation protein FlgA
MARLVLVVVGVLIVASGGLSGAKVRADTVVAAGTIRSQSLIMPGDLVLVPGATPGALSDPADAVGMEAAVNLFPGRPIRPADLRLPAVIERNSIVTIRYVHGGLTVITEGRAMDRAAVGETLRVLNLSSRNTVTVTALAPGLASVGP